MTDNVTPEGEPRETAAPPAGGFGDAAAEVADEPFETPRSSAPQEPSEVEFDGVDVELSTAQTQVEELTADLQRLQAEFVNYKRRVERDRDLVRENATYAALAPIIDVLDTIDRARDHEPLEGGFKAVAEQLERIVTGLGLVKFGAVGDPFDPTVHEALSHIGTDPEVAVTTCKVIAKAGYKIGERVVRAAQVLVVDPAEPATADVPAETAETVETVAEPDPVVEPAETPEQAQQAQQSEQQEQG